LLSKCAAMMQGRLWALADVYEEAGLLARSCVSVPRSPVPQRKNRGARASWSATRVEKG
jgi:hypothetical protein